MQSTGHQAKAVTEAQFAGQGPWGSAQQFQQGRPKAGPGAEAS